jgi:NDP-sugar pyrophosphorylase family protein
MPKALVEVAGRPFIDWLLTPLLQAGAKRFILCSGHLAAPLEQHVRRRRDARFEFSREETPLGTAGAVINALPLVQTPRFVVVNGDSLCQVAFADLVHFHELHRAQATLVLSTAGVRIDGGRVWTDAAGLVTSFLEKPDVTRPGGYLNGGVYLFEKALAELNTPPRPASLEYELLPRIAASGQCYGLVVDSEVVDIGTPDRLVAAGRRLTKN